MSGGLMHLVLGDFAAGVLGEAIAVGALVEGEILRFRDIYCIGPLQKLGTPAGPASRARYWEEVLAHSQISPPTLAEFKEEELRYEVARQAATIHSLLLWTGAHSSSQLWLQRLCAVLPGQPMDLRLIDVAAAGRRTLTQFEPGEVAGLLPRARPLKGVEKAGLAQAWRDNAAVVSGLRRWGQGRISHQGDDFYDTLLLAQCDEQWQPAERVVGAALWECDEYLGDAFFAWRLRCLGRTGRLLWRGPPADLASAEVRLAGSGHA
jgi:uncharacterized protein DUF3658/uncharacterized protein DUF1835